MNWLLAIAEANLKMSEPLMSMITVIHYETSPFIPNSPRARKWLVVYALQGAPPLLPREGAGG